MEMLQGVWKQHQRPRAVVGYGVKIFLPIPPNYVTRSPGGFIVKKESNPYCQTGSFNVTQNSDTAKRQGYGDAMQTTCQKYLTNGNDQPGGMFYHR